MRLLACKLLFFLAFLSSSSGVDVLLAWVVFFEQVLTDRAHPSELKESLDANSMVSYFAATASLKIDSLSQSFEAYLTAS